MQIITRAAGGAVIPKCQVFRGDKKMISVPPCKRQLFCRNYYEFLIKIFKNVKITPESIGILWKIFYIGLLSRIITPHKVE